PSEQPVAVRVPCVTGTQASGQRLASLPLLGLRFTYHEEAALKTLAQRYALQKLEGLTPEELARHLALPHVELAEVVGRLPRRAGHRRDEVPGPVGGAGRIAHRRTGRDRGRPVRRPAARPGPHRRAVADG